MWQAESTPKPMDLKFSATNHEKGVLIMRKLTILFILFASATAVFSQVNKQETR